MKILHLLSAGTIGGIEVLCRDLAKVNKEENVFAFLFRGGPIEEQMISMGATVYKMYQTNRWNIHKYTSRLAKVCEQEQIDIVIVHHEGISTWMYYLLMQKRTIGVRYIRYIHSVFEEKYYYGKNPILNVIKRRLLQAVLTNSDRLIAVSKCVKTSILTHFDVEEDKICVVYNGMREEQIAHNREQQKLVHRGTHLIYMGRLVDVKGVDILIDALAKLKERNTDTRLFEMQLFILGDGEARESLERKTEQLEMQDMISFEGFQLEKEKYLLESDIFIYPSRWQEAFGISILEAMSYGIICIAANVGGIPEIITEGQNGFLYGEESSDQLADKIQVAIQQLETEKADTMRQQALETAATFTIEQTMLQLQNAFGKK